MDQALAIAAGTAALIAAAALSYRYLGRTERLKAEFITILAHKFRTPLTTIKWSVDAMTESETDPYKKQSLEDIRKSNDSLIKLVGTLMELTDRSGAAYKFERLDIGAMARTAVEAAKRRFHEKNLFISIDQPQEPIWIKADNDRLAFVLDVLLSNACAYTPPGREIKASVWARDGKAGFSVKDDGIGMDAADQRRLFTKFFRSDRARSMDTEGFGVGLYLARSVVNRHRGKLHGYSDGPGKGSTFSVLLPRVK